MTLLTYDNFILESNTNIIIKDISDKESKNFIDNTYAATESDQNLLDSIYICSNKKYNIHGAFIKNKIVGVICSKDSLIKDYLSINYIFIDPDNRGKGIGDQLVEYLENRYKTNLITNPYTNEAEIFFKKIGFKINSRIDPNDTNSMIKKIN